MKVVSFAASSSKSSINKMLIRYASTLLEDRLEAEVLDLNDFELPLYSIDREKEQGIPDAATAFLEKLQAAQGIMISFAEHNGTYTAVYKNIFDWCSRIDPKVYQDKKMLLMATSPGQRGGAGVLEAAVKAMPFFGGEIIDSLSVPSFYENFDSQNNKILNDELNEKLKQSVSRFSKSF